MPDLAPITIPRLLECKLAGPKIAALTAYDATLAAAADRAGVDWLLVGDSLGMVIHGAATTLGVSVDDIAYHTRAVARGVARALIVADMPFASCPEPAVAFANAATLIRAGAAMVKLEGAGPVLASIAYLVSREIPVCAHLGLTPQSVHRFGGFKVQARSEAAASALVGDARACADAGASLLVLECVPAALAAEVTAALPIPVIGIGAGAACDGQILVCYDALGVTAGRRPRFVRAFLAGHDSIDAALAAYVAAVRDGTFPDVDEAYA